MLRAPLCALQGIRSALLPGGGEPDRYTPEPAAPAMSDSPPLLVCSDSRGLSAIATAAEDGSPLLLLLPPPPSPAVAHAPLPDATALIGAAAAVPCCSWPPSKAEAAAEAPATTVADGATAGLGATHGAWQLANTAALRAALGPDATPARMAPGLPSRLWRPPWPGLLRRLGGWKWPRSPLDGSPSCAAATVAASCGSGMRVAR